MAEPGHPIADRPIRLHLVRHGQVENPRRVVYGRLPGWSLSEKGRRQADAVARHLSGRDIAAVYSSPLERAAETAEIIAAAFGLTVRVHEDLLESTLASAWEGLSWVDVFVRHHGDWETYRRRPLEMAASEPLAALGTRMAAALRAIAGEHAGTEIVAVSHGDPIKAGVLALTSGDLATLHSEKLETGGLVTIEMDAEGSVRVLERWP